MRYATPQAFREALERVADVRYTITSTLAGRRFEQFPLDIAIGRAPALEPERLRGPDLLAFAGVQAAELPVVALEQHVAEKLHAYTATYGATGQESTRSKDLVDLVLIAEQAELDAERLRRALESTFQQRALQPLPTALPPPPTAWAVSYTAQAREVDAPTNLSAAHAAAAALLAPVLSGATTGRWNPASQKWQPAP